MGEGAHHDQPRDQTRPARLPVYGILTAYGTLKPQPDQVSDPEGWARFVSSPSYLVWHVVGNVVGSVLIIWGTLALGAFLQASRAPRLGLSGAVLTVTGYLLFMVPSTLSTFATPAIGAALLAVSGAGMAWAVLRRRHADSSGTRASIRAGEPATDQGLTPRLRGRPSPKPAGPRIYCPCQRIRRSSPAQRENFGVEVTRK
jgi:hypothetical protein